MYRQCQKFPFETIKTLANALILCHFDYACSSWYSSLTSTTRKKLQTTQNKIVRFVLGLNPRAHIGFYEHSKSGWLPVSYRINQIKAGHMYKILNGLAPAYMERGTAISAIHSHVTRQSNTKNLHKERTGSAGATSFHQTGAHIWNNLPVDIRESSSLGSFKHKLKIHLFKSFKDSESNPFHFY